MEQRRGNGGNDVMQYTSFTVIIPALCQLRLNRLWPHFCHKSTRYNSRWAIL